VLSSATSSLRRRIGSLLQSIGAFELMPLVQPFRKLQQRLTPKYRRRVRICQKDFYSGFFNGVPS
jgi:hypothetical protein